MKAIEIAQRLADLGATEDACQAYTVVLHGSSENDFSAKMEAAAYLMEFGRGIDYQVAYTFFVKLYNDGTFRDTILDIINEAFYQPNVKLQKSRYEKNCKLLAKYPYLFRKDFPKFEELPIKFYPFDDKGFLPFDPSKECFGDYIDFNCQVIGRNFFKNLDAPVLADDVFSQYELEYLNDNVRPSEWIGRENHIYLHYTNWGEFCSYLCCLNMRQLLSQKKIVFLIEDEIVRYPIDFKAEFGLDYSKYPVKPIGIREVNRLIWHTQLSAHNGGDFFNEVFDNHPNLIYVNSIMMSNIETFIRDTRENLKKITNRALIAPGVHNWPDQRIVEELYSLHDRTDKDIMVAMFMEQMIDRGMAIDHDSRIAPAIFFQPHFPNIKYTLEINTKTDHTTLYSEEYETIRQSSIMRGFKYIKTFTPMRRITTSYAASMKFILTHKGNVEHESDILLTDQVLLRVLNRSFMIDPQDRLFKDSRLVRFEDGKLNPTATFTALAAFLDLPYTESLTYCSEMGKKDPKQFETNVVGMDPATVYRTYDEYTCDSERIYIEYFMRDAYAYYGYDFHYYDGKPMTEGAIRDIISDFSVLDSHIRNSWIRYYEAHLFDDLRLTKTVTDDQGNEIILTDEEIEGHDIIKKNIMKSPVEIADSHMKVELDARWQATQKLMRSLSFYGRDGQPLHMMPKLELDPALLEQPLYH